MIEYLITFHDNTYTCIYADNIADATCNAYNVQYANRFMGKHYKRIISVKER